MASSHIGRLIGLGGSGRAVALGADGTQENHGINPFPGSMTPDFWTDPVEPRAAPLLGHRSWGILAEPGGDGGDEWTLVGAGVPSRWDARVHGESRARCVAASVSTVVRAEDHPVGGAPNRRCMCGFYLLKEPAPIQSAIATGTANGWGRVIEHALGWRCEWARPVSVRLDGTELQTVFPTADPERIARRIGERYRCEVELDWGIPTRRSGRGSLWSISVLPAAGAGVLSAVTAFVVGGTMQLVTAACLSFLLAVALLLARR